MIHTERKTDTQAQETVVERRSIFIVAYETEGVCNGLWLSNAWSATRRLSREFFFCNSCSYRVLFQNLS
jgi:hypothetical protein